MAAVEEPASSSPPPPRRDRGGFTIGYALAPKKQQSFIQPSLLSLARSRGFDLIPIDPSLPLASQGPFDLILHKLSTEPWKADLALFSSLHPSVPIIDSPDAIEILHNRVSMLQVVTRIQTQTQTHTYTDTHPTFGIPNQIVVHDSTELSDPEALAGLRFPVIAKPLVADGSASSHEMALIFHRGGLLKQKPPVVLQEFVNHGGVIFKVYVVGDSVKCVKRKSLPDILEEKLLESSEGSLPFSQVSNLTALDQTENYETMHLENAEMPPLSFITEIASELRHAMRLHLFNFDVIRDMRVGNHYLVIDINYFPGYAKMPSYETVLTDFFWNIIHKKREEVGGSALQDEDEKRKVLCKNHSGSEEGKDNVG